MYRLHTAALMHLYINVLFHLNLWGEKRSNSWRCICGICDSVALHHSLVWHASCDTKSITLAPTARGLISQHGNAAWGPTLCGEKCILSLQITHTARFCLSLSTGHYVDQRAVCSLGLSVWVFTQRAGGSSAPGPASKGPASASPDLCLHTAKLFTAPIKTNITHTHTPPSHTHPHIYLYSSSKTIK